MAVHIGQYVVVVTMLHQDVVRKSYLNVLGTSVEDVLRATVEDFP